METTEIQTEECLKAGDFFLAGIKSLQNSDVPIRIIFYGQSYADIVVTVKIADLFANTSVQDLCENPICHSSLFADLLGYILIKQEHNLHKICSRVMDKSYAAKVKEYNHKGFGMRTKDDEIQFQFHVSLVYQLVNEAISREIKHRSGTRLNL